MLVYGDIGRAVEKMHPSIGPIAPGAPAHLVELDLVKRHVVENDMPDVRDIYSLSEC